MADELRPSPQEELAEIESGIAKRRLLLTLIRDAQEDETRRSDFGWFLTLCEEEVGTILAVSSDIHAREWNEIAQRIEQDLLRLEMDQKIRQRELSRNVE